MTTLFLDTGYVIALEASDDQHHKAAVQSWKSLITQRPRLVTTSYVFDEVVTFFNSRGRHGKAVELGHRLLDGRPDEKFSLTDCISFVVMEREGLREALTFDDHFDQAGYRRLPG